MVKLRETIAKEVFMYLNILAEMARRQITKAQMAQKLNMSAWTFDRKLKGESSFTVEEIIEIQNVFNDSKCTFEYLFKENQPA